MTDAGAHSRPPLRLLMLSHYFAEHRGGVEIVADTLAKSLAEQNINVVWAATGGDGPSKGSEAQRLALSAWNGAERAIGIPYPILSLSAWRRIFMAAARADVVVAHDALYLTSVAGFLAARWLGKPFLVIQHIGIVPYRNPLLRALMTAANRFVAEPILAWADRVVFISELTLRHFEKLPWPRPPLLIFNGVNPNIFSPPVDEAETLRARESFDLPKAGPIALFVGRFVEKKGLPLLERVARANPGIVFACAGWGSLDPIGWRLPNVRVFSGLEGERLAGLYRASDALILPSVGEGFPLVIQEALACGLPVVCSAETARADAEAAPFLSGVDFETGDPESAAAAFSNALRRALAAPRDAAARGAFVRARYDWALVAERYAEVMRELAKRRP
ncbi:MAG: glycosyltransferase family 4 protein [Methylocystis sp.]